MDKTKTITKQVSIGPYKRGFHIVTEELLRQLPELSEFKRGVAFFILKHTSASLTINENADYTVRDDFESFFNEFVPEESLYFKHTLEGKDDMPAHLKSSVIGGEISIPITNGKLNMGTWQGIYLCEHRNSSTSRQIIITLVGESNL